RSPPSDHRRHHGDGTGSKPRRVPMTSPSNTSSPCSSGVAGNSRFRNHRIRVLLYAGRPNWDLLATITPC
ncbi:MAG: hypothetical protein M3011_03160, partial [Actinomycetota bacterium]|nr:hypothetical protein [Actinomycetota bacterium]